MKVRKVHLAIATLAVVTPACARSCTSVPVAPPTPTAASAAPALADAATRPPHPAHGIEKALGIQLPERKVATPDDQHVEVIPGLALMPFRRVRDLRPDQTLLLRVAPDGVRILERRLAADQLSQTAQVVDLLQWARDQWQIRSGTAASRVVIAPDAQVAPILVQQVRRAAQAAHGWRVTLLARDGDELVEVVTSMPGERAALPEAGTVTPTHR